jgi:hypothetical protein
MRLKFCIGARTALRRPIRIVIFESSQKKRPFKPVSFWRTLRQNCRMGFGARMEEQMKDETCEWIIDQCERKLHLGDKDFYQVMGGAPQIMEKWMRYAPIAKEFWKVSDSREHFRAWLQSLPDFPPEQVQPCVQMILELLYMIRENLPKAAKEFPRPPGGRPRAMDDSQKREACKRVGQLIGDGLGTTDALKRVADHYGKGFRTMQRVWRERKGKNPRSDPEFGTPADNA